MSNAVTVLAVELLAAGADFERRMSAASAAVSHTANRFDQFNKAAQKAEHRGNEVGASQERMTRNMFLATGAITATVGGLAMLETALIRVAMSSTETFAGFDQTMTRVQSITGETAAGMAMLNAEVARINQTSPLSGQQLADGLEKLAMAGLTASQALVALEPTQKLAVVAGIDMAKAADIASNAINQLGVGAAGLQGVLDAMAVAVTRSNTDLTQLGIGLNYAAGAATGAGLKINETIGALAAFANVGYKASMGGTALRGVISELLDPTAGAKKVMDSLSLSVQDATGKMLPMSNILEQLVYKQAKVEEVFAIFGKRAGGAVAALMANGYKSVDMLKELERATGDAGGALDKMFGTQAQSLENKIKAAESAFENLKLKVGAALEPAVASLADTFQQLFTQMAESDQLINVVGHGVAALVVGFNAVTHAIHAAATVIAVLNAGLVLGEAALRLVGGALGTLVGLFLVLASPILIIIDLVRGLGSEMPLLHSSIGLLTGSFSMMTGALGFVADESAAADEAMGTLKGGLSSARGKADEALDSFKRLHAELRDQEATRALGQSFVILGNTLVSVAKTVKNAWNDALLNPANGMLRAADNFAASFAKGMRDGFKPITDLFTKQEKVRGFDPSRKPIIPDEKGGGASATASAMAAAMTKVGKAADKAAVELERLAKAEEKRRELAEKASRYIAQGAMQGSGKQGAMLALGRKQADEYAAWKPYYQRPNEIYRTASFMGGVGQGFEGTSNAVSETVNKLTKQDELKWLTQQLTIEDSLIEKEKIRNQLMAERLRMGNENLRQIADGAAATFSAIGQEIQLVGVLVDKNSTQKEVTGATVDLMMNLGNAAASAMQMFGVSAEKSLRIQAVFNGLLAVTALGLGLMSAFTNPLAAASYFSAAAVLGGKAIAGAAGAGIAGSSKSEFVAPVKDQSTREDEKEDMRQAFREALEDVGLDELARRDISNNYYLYDPVASDRQEIQARKIERQAERARRRTL